MRWAIAIALLGGCWTRGAAAGDWPQILGPQRNGKAVEEKIASTWASDGPPLVWQRDVGQGYAGVAVRGDRLVLFHRQGAQAIAECLAALSGKPIWRQTFSTDYASTIAPDDGPRCVPLIHENEVYLFGADGDLHCLRLADGQVVWSRQLARDYAAPAGYFGAGSTPIVEGDLVLVNVGGKAESGLVALRRADGQTAWTSTGELASYSSPLATTVDGERQIIFITRLSVVAVEPQTGRVLYQFPFGARGPTVNAATPVVSGDRLFVTASYGVGARLMRIGADGARELWSRDNALSSQYTTPVELDGYLYGIDGRQDVGDGSLRCVELATGKVAWSEENFGTGNLILAGAKLLVARTGGEVMLIDPTPEAPRPTARFRAFGAGGDATKAAARSVVVQALPALANGRLYLRDASQLKCWDLSGSKR